jgi:hypothetical protein
VSCETRDQLAKVFLQAAIEVEKVIQEPDGTPKDTFFPIAAEASAACEKARRDLKRHQIEHGCCYSRVEDSAVRARTGALIADCQRLRLECAERQRKSLELKSACLEAGHACLSSIEKSQHHVRPRMPAAFPWGNGWLHRALASVFLVEPFEDKTFRS